MPGRTINAVLHVSDGPCHKIDRGKRRRLSVKIRDNELVVSAPESGGAPQDGVARST